jgi:hypothetical protein
VADIAGAVLEENVDLALEKRFVEVHVDGKLRTRWRQKFTSTQIRHPKPPGSSKPKSKPIEEPSMEPTRCAAGAPVAGHPNARGRRIPETGGLGAGAADRQ